MVTATDRQVLVRWVGIRRRYRHATDEDGYGLYDESGQPIIEIDYDHENRREVPWPGVGIRILNPEMISGLSRTYTFGPDEDTYTQLMSERDFQLVKATEIAGAAFEAVDGA